MGEPKNNLREFRAPKPKPRDDMQTDAPQISGEAAAVSGIYRLEHEGKHPIQEEMLVQKGICLPGCAICGKPITFHLLQAVKPIGEDPDFK
jgi:hypothetical protein